MREGLSDLVRRVRLLVDDGTAGVWTDDELQDFLDLHRVRVDREPLSMEETYVSSSSIEYKRYQSRFRDFEWGGTATFKVEDSAGSVRGTAEYTPDYVNGRVEMITDQGGSALYLTAWSYDLNGVAAMLWKVRAGKVSGFYDFKADEHSMSRSQWFRHCLEMSSTYEKLARARTIRSWRVGDRRDA